MNATSTLAQQYELVKSRLAAACAKARRDVSEVTLVAVTKTATPQQIREVVGLGIRDLGESRAQVFTEHVAALQESLRDRPGELKQVRWHMIGHLQRNKVKQVLPHAVLVHSVDSLRLAEEIEEAANKQGVKARVLLQVNAGEEPQKYGAAVGAAVPLAEQIAEMKGIELCGLMTMAPLTEDQGRIRAAFARMRELFEEMKWHKIGSMKHLSMGMSHDFEIAIEEGATLVRVGSLLFGEARQEAQGE